MKKLLAACAAFFAFTAAQAEFRMIVQFVIDGLPWKV